MEKTSLNEDQLIMVVDDSEQVAEVLSAILRSMGFRTVTYLNGVEAVAGYMAAWKDIRLVMLDINMPDIDGREVFSKMKEINPDVDAIFVSGFCAKDEIRALLQMGARGFVEKPFGLEALSRSVGDIVGSGNSGGAGTASLQFPPDLNGRGREVPVPEIARLSVVE